MPHNTHLLQQNQHAIFRGYATTYDADSQRLAANYNCSSCYPAHASTTPVKSAIISEDIHGGLGYRYPARAPIWDSYPILLLSRHQVNKSRMGMSYNKAKSWRAETFPRLRSSPQRLSSGGAVAQPRRVSVEPWCNIVLDLIRCQRVLRTLPHLAPKSSQGGYKLSLDAELRGGEQNMISMPLRNVDFRGRGF